MKGMSMKGGVNMAKVVVLIISDPEKPKSIKLLVNNASRAVGVLKFVLVI